MKRLDDSGYVGHRFGRWTVVDVDIEKCGRNSWECRCDCGSQRMVNRWNLLGGATNGCRKCFGLRGNKNPAWRGHGSVPSEYWGILRRSAASRGIPVAVSISDLDRLWSKQSGRCAISGLRIVLGTKKSGCSASLDRIDSSKGYVEGNIQWVHKDINRMKSDFGQEKFVSLCNLVSSYR